MKVLNLQLFVNIHHFMPELNMSFSIITKQRMYRAAVLLKSCNIIGARTSHSLSRRNWDKQFYFFNANVFVKYVVVKYAPLF